MEVVSQAVDLIETVDCAANLAQKRIDALGRLLLLKELKPIASVSSAVSERRLRRITTEIKFRVIVQADGEAPGKTSMGGLRQEYYPAYGAQSVSAITALAATYADLLPEEVNFWERLADITKSRLTLRPTIANLILTPQVRGTGMKSWLAKNSQGPVLDCNKNWADNLPKVEKPIPEQDWNVGDDEEETLENINQELWNAAIERQLLPSIIRAGYLTEKDILLLQAHFTDKGVTLDSLDKKFDQLSLAVANLV